MEEVVAHSGAALVRSLPLFQELDASTLDAIGMLLGEVEYDEWQPIEVERREAAGW